MQLVKSKNGKAEEKPLKNGHSNGSANGKAKGMQSLERLYQIGRASCRERVLVAV